MTKMLGIGSRGLGGRYPMGVAKTAGIGYANAPAPAPATLSRGFSRKNPIFSTIRGKTPNEGYVFKGNKAAKAAAAQSYVHKGQ